MPRIKGQSARTTSGGQTRERLREAAAHLLATRGYAATTTRAIAQQAGGDAALVAYHYGSLNDLLLAALDASNQSRMAAYRAALAEADSRRGVLAAVRDLYEEDRRSGHTAIVAQLVAGGLMDRALGTAVAQRMRPWLELTESALDTYLPQPLRRHAPTRELAYVIVAGFLGLELLDDLLAEDAEGGSIVASLAAWRPWALGLRGARQHADEDEEVPG